MIRLLATLLIVCTFVLGSATVFANDSYDDVVESCGFEKDA